jgi:G3E family GTPase
VNLAGQEKPVVLHGVQHVLYPETTLDAWPDDGAGLDAAGPDLKRVSRFVFIVRELDPEFVENLLRDFTQTATAEKPG